MQCNIAVVSCTLVAMRFPHVIHIILVPVLIRCYVFPESVLLRVLYLISFYPNSVHFLTTKYSSIFGMMLSK